jgi:hypothetical protein
MLFCQSGRARSLREICYGLALDYANARRPWSLCQTVFEQLLAKCRASVAGRRTRKKFRFKNRLVSLDARFLDLSLFDWARFRRTKAVKLHLLLDHDAYLPSFIVVTNGKTNDIKYFGQQWRLPASRCIEGAPRLWSELCNAVLLVRSRYNSRTSEASPSFAKTLLAVMVYDPGWHEIV